MRLSRHILKLFLIFVLSSFFVSCNKSATLSFNAMDTFMTVKSFGPEADKANHLLKDKIITIENYLSTTIEGSDVYRLNHAEEFPVTVNYNTIFPLALSIVIADRTGGALNPCLYPVTKEWGFTTGEYKVPSDKKIAELLKNTDYKKIDIEDDQIYMEKGMMVDLGAIGKGFAGDQAIAVLKANGITSAILDLGGNVQCLGNKPDGSLWKVGIVNPWNGGIIGSVRVNDTAVITSGGYERYFIAEDGKEYVHILDPSNGYPVDNDVVSSTIIADYGIYADALSTATFVMGPEKALELYRRERSFEMIMILKNHRIIVTPGIADNFTTSSPEIKFEVVN